MMALRGLSATNPMNMYSRSSEPVRFERDCAAVLVPQGDAVNLPAGASDDDVEQMVWRQLRTCFDPEIPINVVDLGLVYEATVSRRDDGERTVAVKMTLTAPGCGMGDILVDDVRSKLEMIPTVAEADVELVFDPPWNRNMMSEAARLETGML
jgi:probable FeS assembly SUF system protein SufT